MEIQQGFVQTVPATPGRSTTVMEIQQEVIRLVPSSPRITTYNSRASFVLGGLQLMTVGALCVILHITGIATGTGSYYYSTTLFVVAHGIWGGIAFIVTGLTGICAARSKTESLINCFCGMSIACAAVFVPAVILVDSVALFRIENFEPVISELYYSYYGDVNLQVPKRLHLGLLSLAFIEFVVAVLSSVLTCRTMGVHRRSGSSEGQAVYIPMGNRPQQVTLFTPGGSPQGEPTQYMIQPAGGVHVAPTQYMTQPAGGLHGAPTQYMIQPAGGAHVGATQYMTQPAGGAQIGATQYMTQPAGGAQVGPTQHMIQPAGGAQVPPPQYSLQDPANRAYPDSRSIYISPAARSGDTIRNHTGSPASPSTGRFFTDNQVFVPEHAEKQ